MFERNINSGNETGRFLGFGRFSRRQAPPEAPAAPSAAAQAPPKPGAGEGKPGFDMVELKVRMHQKLLDVINLSAIDKVEPETFRLEAASAVRELLGQEQVPLNQQERDGLVADILDELLGLGPIEPLLKDPTVSDILCNTWRHVYVERGGRLEATAVRFKDDRHLLRIINKIVAAVGRRVDESQPMVDARLPDGSRVNAVTAPVAVDGPLLSIRKFSDMPFTLERLVGLDALTEEMAFLLRAIVRGRLNVLISGGTGSGKTTMLNAMSAHIDHRERIVTIEDTAELRLQQPHVARMETRPPNVEGRGEIAQRELVKNALRMRPDRIIVGECRAGEAFDMLQAMNTGHDGSMTTIHANTCRDALSRLEQMIGMAGLDLPTRSMRAQIASAIDVVLQLQRMSDGRRRLISLHEITGMEGEVVTMQEIFRFRRDTTDGDGTVHGRFWASGVRPNFLDDLQAKGLEIDPALFSPDHPLGARR